MPRWYPVVFDLRMLAILDACFLQRATVAEIVAGTGLSRSAVYRRLRRLEAAGLLRRHRAGGYVGNESYFAFDELMHLLAHLPDQK